MLLSLIIPTRNEARNIRVCVETLRWAADAGLAEILVVDNGSADGTSELARAAGARVFEQGPERSAQRNRGAREVVGDYLLFVDADMRVIRSTLEEILARLQAPAPPDALYIREQMAGAGWWVRVPSSVFRSTCGAWKNSAIRPTTVRCSASVSSGKIGSANVSLAASSVSGRSPFCQPRYSKHCCRWSGTG